MFWKIPVKDPEVEIPLCLIQYFIAHVRADTDFLALPLYSSESCTHTASSSLFKTAFKKYLNKGGFCKLVLAKEGYNEVYYATSGAVLDKNFIPVWVCSWKMSKDELGHWSCNQPVVRYSNSLFQKKNDPMATYLTSTLFKKLLDMEVSNPERYCHYHPLTVAISPYNSFCTLQRVNIPSVSVTDRDLRMLALSYADRFFT